MCTKGSFDTQSLLESASKFLASLDIFRWHFQRQRWCALAINSLWIPLSMHLQTCGFVSIILHKTALFQPTHSMIFKSLYRPSMVFHKDTILFLDTGIPSCREREEHFSKQQQVKSNDLAVVLVNSSREELKVVQRRRVKNLHWGLMRQKNIGCCSCDCATPKKQQWELSVFRAEWHTMSSLPQPSCGTALCRAVQVESGHSYILAPWKSLCL